jgi:hypothetical protein
MSRASIYLSLVIFACTLHAQVAPAKPQPVPPPTTASAPDFSDNPDAAPPVSEQDIRIVERARTILSSPDKWNRADNRRCPKAATTFSLYCALEKATAEVTGGFQHRGAAMQQARFVIDEDLARGNHYDHRLMNFNNDPKTTFADTRKFWDLLEQRIRRQLKEGKTSKPTNPK